MLLFSTNMLLSNDGLATFKLKSVHIDYVQGVEFKNMKVVVEKESDTWLLLHDAFDSSKYVITKCVSKTEKHECINIYNTFYNDIHQETATTHE